MVFRSFSLDVGVAFAPGLEETTERTRVQKTLSVFGLSNLFFLGKKIEVPRGVFFFVHISGPPDTTIGSFHFLTNPERECKMYSGANLVDSFCKRFLSLGCVAFSAPIFEDLLRIFHTIFLIRIDLSGFFLTLDCISFSFFV